MDPYECLEGLALSDIRLPAVSRNARRLAARLEPAAGPGFFAWRLCRGGGCWYCVVFGREYRVEFRRVAIRDPLSGLDMRLPEPRGLVDGRVVWEARWRGGLLRVEGFSCDAIVRPGGVVECAGEEGGSECVERVVRACSATQGP